MGGAAPHPFAARYTDLEQAIVSLGLSEMAELATPGLMSIRLPSAPATPTHPAAPMPSPELILDNRPEPGKDTQLLTWAVPAQLLDPAQTVDFLLALPAESLPGLAFGGSLRFWSEAIKFALELATRQSFAPTIQKTEEGGSRAVWQAVLIGDDDDRAAALAKAMPPLCRALDAGVPPPSAQACLSSFLHHTIDALARHALASSRWLSLRRTGKGQTMLDQWLQALAAQDIAHATLTGRAEEIDAFAGQVGTWLDQLRPAANTSPFRTCFRLAEPDASDGRRDWELSFYLQANDDKSLLVPAERVWRERSSTLTYLKRKFQNPQERLLEDLGRAARLFPPLESSLNDARPTDLALKTEQAYSFLRESAPLLEQSGFGVWLPAWWQKRSARLGVKLQLRPKQGPRVNQSLMGKEAVVGYNWQVALGDQTLSFDEFKALAELKVPLVNVRGQWVELQQDEIERAIAFFEKKRGQGEMDLSEAMRIGLGQEQSETGLPVVDVEGEGWVGDFLNRVSEDARIPEVEPPATFSGQLRPYQLRGVSWLSFLRQYGLGACLADDMGLGKCVAPDTRIFVNGALETAESLWHSQANDITFDGEGYWATPNQVLTANSLDPQTGRVVCSRIDRLYRQWVDEKLKRITLTDGSQITITARHHLLTPCGWTNDLRAGDYVCVPARLAWEEESGDAEWTAEALDRCASLDMGGESSEFRSDALRRSSRIAKSGGHIERRGLGSPLGACRYWVDAPSSQSLAIPDSLPSDLAARTRHRDDLQCLIEQQVFYCKIKTIEDVAYQGWVYDFEVGGYHNFVANCIVCHNTVQLIASLLSHQPGESGSAPTLLICPMSIVGNWQRELQRFGPSLQVMVHHGAERLSGQAFEDEVNRHDVVLTTYSLVHRDAEHLARIAWDNVVIDEAQNIKNPSAKQTQAIRKLNAAHRIALTGTPVENRLSELWSIMDFLNKGYLGSAKDFHTRFAQPIEKYRDADRSATLKRLIQPFVLRRLKTDKSIIADLPDKMEMKVLCNLTAEQATLYQAVVKDMLAKIEQTEGIERRGLVLATLMKLKQVCNHPAHFLSDGSALPGRSGKLARLEEMLEEALAAGDRALVFSQFAEMGDMLRRHLQTVFAREVLFLHGGTPKQQRDTMVQRFQSGQGPSIFLLSIKAGGVGLNLTAANHVFHFDRWWNPAVENQATDRAFRIGQTKNVQVHKFVCVGTLEERIDQMIEQKKDLAERIVGAGENWLTEMSTAQLRDLFALGREAVGE